MSPVLAHIFSVPTLMAVRSETANAGPVGGGGDGGGVGSGVPLVGTPSRPQAAHTKARHTVAQRRRVLLCIEARRLQTKSQSDAGNDPVRGQDEWFGDERFGFGREIDAPIEDAEPDTYVPQWKEGDIRTGMPTPRRRRQRCRAIRLDLDHIAA